MGNVYQGVERRRIIMQVIGIEGEYSDHPSDSGGKTMYGITEAVANRHKLNVQQLSIADTVGIYEQDYWHPLNLDEVVMLSKTIAEELFDTAVNMGVHRAGEYLQRSLNVLNKKGSWYVDLKVDGDIGSKTLGALKVYLNKRGEKGEGVLLKILNSLQGAFYVRLAERREKDEAFIYGWFDNRVVI